MGCLYNGIQPSNEKEKEIMIPTCNTEESHRNKDEKNLDVKENILLVLTLCISEFATVLSRSEDVFS